MLVQMGSLSLVMLAGGVLVRAILFGITEEAASSSVASVADVLGSLLEAYGTSTVGIQRAGKSIMKCVAHTRWKALRTSGLA